METGNPSLLEGIKETYHFAKRGSFYGFFFRTAESKTATSSNGDIGVYTAFSLKDIEEPLSREEWWQETLEDEHWPENGFCCSFLDSEGNIMGVYASH